MIDSPLVSYVVVALGSLTALIVLMRITGMLRYISKRASASWRNCGASRDPSSAALSPCKARRVFRPTFCVAAFISSFRFSTEFTPRPW